MVLVPLIGSCMCECGHSVVSNSVTLWFLSPWDFSGKNRAVGCHFPPPGDLPNPGREPLSPVPLELQADSLPTEPSGNPNLPRLFKITVDGDCNHEIKRHLLLGRTVMTNLGSILKSRDITLLTKVHIIKAMVFPVVMYGCERWTIKKAECQRIDAFKLWCWRSLLRVCWIARRSNQPILKEMSPEYSSERLMLKLKLQYFGRLTWRTDSLEKTMMLGKTEGRRRRGWQRMNGWIASLTQWTWVWASSGS